MRKVVDGRVFFITETVTGHTCVKERILLHPGRPWECFSDKTIYHSGAGRRPGKTACKVLDIPFEDRRGKKA